MLVIPSFARAVGAYAAAVVCSAVLGLALCFVVDAPSVASNPGPTASKTGLSVGTAGPLAVWEGRPSCGQQPPTPDVHACLAALPPPERYPARGMHHTDRALIFVWFRSWLEARQEAESAILADAASVQAQLFAARVALTEHSYSGSADRYGHAVQHLERALELAPKNADALATRAYVHGLRGRIDAALAGYNAALAIAPNQIFALGERARCLNYAKKPDAALADYDLLTKLEPRNVHWTTMRASLRLALGDNAGAIEDFTAALQLGGHAMTIYTARADAYLAKGNAEAAYGDLSALIDGPSPGITFAIAGEALAATLFKRGWAGVALGKKAEATNDLIRAAEVGGLNKILRLQLLLRQRGWKIEIDGKNSDALKKAVGGCLVDDKCEQAMRMFI